MKLRANKQAKNAIPEGKDKFESRSGHSKNLEISSKSKFLSNLGKNGPETGPDIFDYRKRFMAVKKAYTTPRLVRGKSDWYVVYEHEIPGKPGEFKRFKVRDGVNYHKDEAMREQALQALRNDVQRWLEKENYSPFLLSKDVKEDIDITDQEIHAPKNWTIATAIAEYLKFIKNHGYSERTRETYKCYVDDLGEWVAENNQFDVPAFAYNEVFVMNFLDTFAENREWSSRTYNNNLEFFGSFFNRCQKLERRVDRAVKYQFDIDLADLKITTPQVNKPYPTLIKKAIKKLLRAEDLKDLRDYVEWIYYSCMRPAEIRTLKVSDLDIDSRQIRILGKSGDRIIPISDQLLKLINRRGVLKQGLNNYVFGCAGKISVERMGESYFLELYNEHIKKPLELGPEYKIYSWKATAVIDMIIAGFSDKAIRALTGHKTDKAFEAYKRDLVIDNNHLMKQSVVDF